MLFHPLFSKKVEVNFTILPYVLTDKINDNEINLNVIRYGY